MSYIELLPIAYVLPYIARQPYCFPDSAKSKACQIAAWKVQHKESCFLHDGLAVGQDGRLREPGLNTEAGQHFQLEKRLDKWLQHWRRILYGFTPFAQDLANHPDRPDSHW